MELNLNKFWRKISFFIVSFSIYFTPKPIRRWQVKRFLNSLSDQEREKVRKRTDYYVKFKTYRPVPEIYRRCGEEKPSIVKMEDYIWKKRNGFSLYFLDLYRYVSTYSPNVRIAYLFGDIREEFDFPFFTKTRPIRSESYSIITKLDSARHFNWAKDKIPYREKLDMAVARNYVLGQPHRTRLFEMYISHPICDFGMVNNNAYLDHPEWHKSYLSREQQMRYKFIMTLEGNDVATNLKWVMSSNSIAVMPRPKFESWFMEGTLKPDFHYILIKDDYSDLIERLQYYIHHTSEAEQIVMNAHQYVSEFFNKRIDNATEYNVAQRYLELTEQI